MRFTTVECDMCGAKWYPPTSVDLDNVIAESDWEAIFDRDYCRTCAAIVRIQFKHSILNDSPAEPRGMKAR